MEVGKKLFLGTSDRLGKKWVVHAWTVEDATGKVVLYSKVLLAQLEKEGGGDIDVDLVFTEITEEVMEI